MGPGHGGRPHPVPTHPQRAGDRLPRLRVGRARSVRQRSPRPHGQQTLYAHPPGGPHYPSLVPSQYKEYTESGSETGGEDSGGSTGGDTGGSETTTYPKWSELEDGHVFNVGDYFTDYAKTYHVLRQFTKQANWRPPALTGDFYEEVTA